MTEKERELLDATLRDDQDGKQMLILRGQVLAERVTPEFKAKFWAARRASESAREMERQLASELSALLGGVWGEPLTQAIREIHSECKQ